MVISQYGLDVQPFLNKIEKKSWSTSDLRQWLNSSFYCAAFSGQEMKCIAETTVNCSNIWGGNETTKDRVFLLSYAEANRYFGLDNHENMASRAAPTAYAVAAGAFASETYLTETGEPAGYWWLRSPIHSGHNATNVNSNGDRVGWDDTPSSNRMIRPAIWVEQSAVIR